MLTPCTEYTKVPSCHRNAIHCYQLWFNTHILLLLQHSQMTQQNANCKYSSKSGFVVDSLSSVRGTKDSTLRHDHHKDNQNSARYTFNMHAHTAEFWVLIAKFTLPCEITWLD